MSIGFSMRCLLATAIAGTTIVVSVGHAGDRQVVGWIERVALTDQHIVFEAKVDTGADTSSVHAENIRYFSQDGAQWVEFTLHDQTGQPIRLQRPLERMAQIKKKTSGYQSRPVVILQVCVGDVQRGAEVNLSQRAHFRYPVLLGRNFLSGHYLVDSDEKYLLAPSCSGDRGN